MNGGLMMMLAYQNAWAYAPTKSRLETIMQQLSLSATAPSATRLNPLALAFGFGVAGVVEILLFGTVMGAMSGMMGGNGGGWMMGGGGPGYRGGSMMGGSVGFFVYALIWGFFGSSAAGGIAALVYNAVNSRNA